MLSEQKARKQQPHRVQCIVEYSKQSSQRKKKVDKNKVVRAENSISIVFPSLALAIVYGCTRTHIRTIIIRILRKKGEGEGSQRAV